MMTRHVALAGLLLTVLAVGCSRSRPSVILVSIDSLRYDDVFGAPSGRAIAPNLTALAHESVNYERAYSSAPWTTPAMMGVMTGLSAPAHGVEEHDRMLASSVGALAERFRGAGYHTAAFLPAITLRAEFGFARGFEIFDLENFGHQRVSSPTLVGKVLQRIENWRRERRPFFIWVHLWDPHYNYIPPPPYDDAFAQGNRPRNEDVQCLKWVLDPLVPAEVEYLRGQYRGEISFTDKYVGELLDQVKATGLDGKLIVAVLGDHGEAFQEHGWLSHTNRVDEEVIHVPLLLRWSKKLRPRMVGEVVSTAELGATLLVLAGLDGRGFGLEPPLPGLKEPASVGASGKSRSVLSETVRQGCFTALVGVRYKYVLDHRTCAESLFDLTTDPGEKKDLSALVPDRLADLRAALKKELERLRSANIPRGAMPADVAHEAEAALRSLGYLGGGRTTSGGEQACALAPRTGRYDTFGDLRVDPCPAEGAWKCLDDR